MFKKILILSVGVFMLCDAVGIFKASTCQSIKLKYGRTRYRQKGRFAKFVCNTGYLLAGEKYSTCVNGTWDGPIAKCVRASCKKVTPPVNSLIYPSHRGAVLNFFCKPGFDLLGTTTLYCDGHNWEESLPSCFLTNTKPSLTCDFESIDLCGWNHDLRHDFDWTRMNFRTPSGHLGTGPSFDHTLGEGKDGYYMYIESSSRRINDTARLISPIYNPMIENDVCLEFYYHMHGASTGQLRVYLKKISETWLLYPENAIFWKMGNHGNKWLHGFIRLGPINEDFQIIIEGVRGTSFFSDIAIDDVSIIPNCTYRDITTERDEVYTIDYSPTQSCFNRCDSDNAISTNSNLASCGCDDTCTDNNTCCPDYIALCVVGTTEDSYTTSETTVFAAETSSASTAKKLNKTSTTASPSVPVKYTRSTNATSIPINRNGTSTKTTLVPFIAITANGSTSSTKPSMIKPVIYTNYTDLPIKSSSASTKQPSVFTKPSKAPSVSVKPPAATPEKPPSVRDKERETQPVKPNVKPPSVREKEPSEPIQPVKPNVTDKMSNTSKTLPINPANKPQSASATPPSSTTNPPSVPKLPTFTKYVQKQNISTRASLSSQSVTSPTIDELATIPVHLDYKDNEEEGVVPVIYKDKETLATSNVEKQKIVQEVTSQASNTTTVVIAVLAVSVVLVSVLVVALVRRYRYTCNRSRIRGSSSESQSDVRFLTSDEVLDFHLAYSDG